MAKSAQRRHLRAEPIDTPRLRLEPLRVGHADELVDVLADDELHTYIGGAPARLEQLRGRFDLKSHGVSADGLQTWLNWVLRAADTSSAVGFVQATISPSDTGPVAELAWVVGVEHQRQGLASEAGAAVAAWLAERDVRRLLAHVHPANVASQVVARRLGLHPTETVVDGETEWVGEVTPSGWPAVP